MLPEEIDILEGNINKDYSYSPKIKKIIEKQLVYPSLTRQTANWDPAFYQKNFVIKSQVIKNEVRNKIEPIEKSRINNYLFENQLKVNPGISGLPEVNQMPGALTQIENYAENGLNYLKEGLFDKAFEYASQVNLLMDTWYHVDKNSFIINRKKLTTNNAGELLFLCQILSQPYELVLTVAEAESNRCIEASIQVPGLNSYQERIMERLSENLIHQKHELLIEWQEGGSKQNEFIPLKEVKDLLKNGLKFKVNIPVAALWCDFLLYRDGFLFGRWRLHCRKAKYELISI